MTNQKTNVSHYLAEETGRPVEDFEPDYEQFPLPNLTDLEWEEVDTR